MRGLSETDVRSFLRRVAGDVDTLQEQENELHAHIAELEQRLANPPELSEADVLDAVGEETARVLRSARSAGEDLRRKAAESAAELTLKTEEELASRRAEFEQEIAQKLQQSEQQIADRRQSAEQTATAIVAEAEDRAASIRADADRYAQQHREDAETEAAEMIETARVSGREMVTEARALREKIVSDLTKRKNLLAAQITELREGRERLLEAYKVVKDTLSSATGALSQAAQVAQAQAADAMLNNGAVAVSTEIEVDAEISNVDVESQDTKGIRSYMKDAFGIHDDESDVLVVDHDDSDSEVKDEVSIEQSQTSVQPDSADEVDTSTEIDIRSEELSDEDSEDQEGDGVDALFARLREERGNGSKSGSPVSSSDEAKQEEQVQELQKPDALVLRDEELSGARTGIAKRVKRALQDEQNEMLDAIRKSKGNPTASKVFPKLERQIQAWVEVIDPFVREAHAAGGAQDVSDAYVRQSAEQLVTPLRERISDGFNQAENPDDFVKARYREWKTQFLPSLIDDLMNEAYSQGVYASVPEGTKVAWVNSGCCADCADNALEPVTRGDKFPTGQLFPPAHPGCDCTLTVAD